MCCHRYILVCLYSRYDQSVHYSKVPQSLLLSTHHQYRPCQVSPGPLCVSGLRSRYTCELLKHECSRHPEVQVIRKEAEHMGLTFPDALWGNVKIPRPFLTFFCKNYEIKNILGKSQIRFLSKGLQNILDIYWKNDQNLMQKWKWWLTFWATVCSSVKHTSRRRQQRCQN